MGQLTGSCLGSKVNDDGEPATAWEPPHWTEEGASQAAKRQAQRTPPVAPSVSRGPPPPPAARKEEQSRAAGAQASAQQIAPVPPLRADKSVPSVPVEAAVAPAAKAIEQENYHAVDGLLVPLANGETLQSTQVGKDRRKRLQAIAEENYKLRMRWPIPRTMCFSYSDCEAADVPKGDSMPRVSFSSSSTADALLRFGAGHGKVCGLNFANGRQVGGGYKNGAIAQEEDLCRRIPNLYTTLNQAKRDGLYPFGPCTCASADRPEKYSDVLFTPDLVVARAGEDFDFTLLPKEQQVTVSLVTAAAPNLQGREPEIMDIRLAGNTIRSIFIAPRILEPAVTTLVLGAWGCGAFGGDPVQISELFVQALSSEGLGNMYREVHFAIPRRMESDPNTTAFKAALARHQVSFEEV